MNPQFRTFILAAAALASFAPPAGAKRIPPDPVTPVVANGVQYSAEGAGRDQFVVAKDVSTAKELWRVRVFRTRVNTWKEIDVQLVFITDLKLEGNSLLVRDERSRCYAVSLLNHRVKKQPCGGAFADKK